MCDVVGVSCDVCIYLCMCNILWVCAMMGECVILCAVRSECVIVCCEE